MYLKEAVQLFFIRKGRKRITLLLLYLPQMVLKINGMFEARRGKKRMKKVSQSAESNSGRGENFIMTVDSRTDQYLFVHFCCFPSNVEVLHAEKDHFCTVFCRNYSLQLQVMTHVFLLLAQCQMGPNASLS